jgi:hypothetical protein
MFVEIADDGRRVKVDRVITCSWTLLRLPHLVRSHRGLKNIIPASVSFG